MAKCVGYYPPHLSRLLVASIGDICVNAIQTLAYYGNHLRMWRQRVCHYIRYRCQALPSFAHFPTAHHTQLW